MIVEILLILGLFAALLWAVLALTKRIGTDVGREISKSQVRAFEAHHDEPLSEKVESLDDPPASGAKE